MWIWAVLGALGVVSGWALCYFWVARDLEEELAISVAGVRAANREVEILRDSVDHLVAKFAHAVIDAGFTSELVDGGEGIKLIKQTTKRKKGAK